MLKRFSPPRALSLPERLLVERLLNAPFEGATELRSQLSTARVVEEFRGGVTYFKFVVDRERSQRALNELRVPVEGYATDSDGADMVILLHVVEGYLQELELWRGDSVFVRELPHPSALRVIVGGGPSPRRARNGGRIPPVQS